MPKTPSDLQILKLIVRLYVDIFNLTNQWILPDSIDAINNFAGRNMVRIQKEMETLQSTHSKGLERKPSFSIDTISSLALQVILRALQIGRAINKIRVSQNRPTIDWYARAIEEDNNERINQKETESDSQETED